MQIANLCPISQPLDIIHEIINEKCGLDLNDNLTLKIHERFNNEFLSEETEKTIPHFDSNANYSLVKVSNAMIIQDCIEDEFYQPFMKLEDGTMVNSGLWTRSLYGNVPDCHCEEPDYSKLQVRKRLLAACKKTGKPFILSIYRQRKNENEEEWESWRQDTFKMNSMHQFIGIYEVDTDGDLPMIHLIKRSDFVIENLIPIEEGQFVEIRRKLIEYLSSCLGGSKEAAEALILSLVSKHSMRVDGLVESLFIGKLTLNLCVTNSQVAEDSALELFKVLKGIKPFVAGPVRVESSVEGAFTKESIYPRLDVSSGQLCPGAVLQQPDGSVLIVDEIGLKEGEFKDQAVCNLQSIIDLIRFQHVNYDFGMQQVPLKTDMPVITVSLKKKSVLPFDLKVECTEIKAVEISSDSQSLFSSYLNRCRELNCTVSEEMAAFLEQDYLSLRKSSPLLPNGNPKMNEHEFHRLMNLARLTAVSHGKRGLEQAIWDETKARYNN